MKWIPVATMLPENSKRVLFTWLNSLNCRRTALGFYAGEIEVDVDWDQDAWPEEEDGTVLLPAGWYEESYECECIEPIVKEVTHWMPLPPKPEDNDDE